MSLPPSLRESRNYLLSNKKRALAFRIAASLLATFLILQINLDFFEFYLYDLRERLKPTSKTENLTQLIFVDQKSVEDLKGHPSYDDYANLLEKLIAQKPDYILLNLRFDEIQNRGDGQKRFLHLAQSFPNLIVITNELEMKGEENKLLLAPPLNHLKVLSGPKTSDIKIFAKDSVTRRMLVTYQGQKLLHYEIAAHYNKEIEDIKNIRGAFDFYSSDQVYIDFRPTGTYPSRTLSEVLKNGFQENEMKGKIIIIGPDDERTSKDYIMTPLSRDLLSMTTTEMHANMIDTLIQNKGIITAPSWLNYLITVLISIITIHVVFTLKPLIGLAVLASTVCVSLFVNYIFFWPFGIWVGMAHPALAVFLCYYFFIPYRLIVENRRSWEYYQKNKLLHQVEELKTNFISMMSHDLKTPIARIQGMAEVIAKDASPLSNMQREALDTIKTSGDDLLKFINAILQYGRIESQGVELHLQSRDVNSLLKDVIKKHEFLAKLKRIQILEEFEILFPIQVDPELIKQVFSNLIENAIKYSPEDSKVLVSTEEAHGKIIVQVADQGQGIESDELPNIFMKFFRSKNAKSSPIKGSGLGLYLAKYFTKLHHGTLTVESTYGHGSTFTVELPVSTSI